jgi:hypothetical protein
MTPLTAFTGLPADGILKAVLRRVPNQVVKMHSLQDARAQQVLQLELAKKALEMMHVSVRERRTKKQLQFIDTTHAQSCDMWTSTWVTTYCKQNFFDTTVGNHGSMVWTEDGDQGTIELHL